MMLCFKYCTSYVEQKLWKLHHDDCSSHHSAESIVQYMYTMYTGMKWNMGVAYVYFSLRLIPHTTPEMEWNLGSAVDWGNSLT